MNKDLEQFENRSDDWLAKQRNIENRPTHSSPTEKIFNIVFLK